jgi:hypothetical protein
MRVHLENVIITEIATNFIASKETQMFMTVNFKLSIPCVIDN